MKDFDVLLRSPNLGHPIMAEIVRDKPTFFQATFASFPEMNIVEALRGNLYLQSLQDTQKILQKKISQAIWSLEKEADWERSWDMDLWPSRIKQALIPLEIEKVEEPIKSEWTGVPIFLEPVGNNFGCLKIFDTDLGIERQNIGYSHAYPVTLRINSESLSGLNLPQLFNIVQDMPNENVFNLNFHALYLHTKKWQDFSFIQATDTHIAWRNDFISQKIQNDTGQKPKEFKNFNENFRGLIRHANQLHRQSKLDFILITGDLVDYIDVKRTFASEELQFRYPRDNFNFLRDIIVAWKMIDTEIVDEELEVPVFTILGNHDYRPSEYPLIATYELGGGKDLYTSEQYSAFSLTREEALIYESGSKQNMPYYGAYEGIHDQSHLPEVPYCYRAYINPDQDYIIPLDKHKIICLDSGPDKGEITGLIDGWLNTDALMGPRYDFIHTTPDGEGFKQEQIKYVEEQVKNAEGIVILACHHPILNFRHVPPPHFFRETEHRNLSPTDRQELSTILGVQEYMLWIAMMGREYYKCLAEEDEQGAMLWALNMQAFTFEYWADTFGWPLGGTAYFKKGGREPELGRGVPDNYFFEFLDAINIKTNNKKKVELVLTGHTHRSIEYRISTENNVLTLLHDYYIDGSVEGKTPTQHWGINLPEYPNPLSKAKNVKQWWQNHSPLFVQALSATAPPPSSPNTGVLRIVIQNDIITKIERAWPSPNMFNQPYFILANNPP